MTPGCQAGSGSLACTYIETSKGCQGRTIEALPHRAPVFHIHGMLPTCDLEREPAKLTLLSFSDCEVFAHRFHYPHIVELR